MRSRVGYAGRRFQLGSRRGAGPHSTLAKSVKDLKKDRVDCLYAIPVLKNYWFHYLHNDSVQVRLFIFTHPSIIRCQKFQQFIKPVVF